MAKPITSNIGERFGRLTVTAVSDKRTSNGSRVYRDVICDCGTVKKDVQIWSLKSGQIKSCGCLRVEFGKAKKGITKYTGDTAALLVAYRDYRASANGRNYPFELTTEEFREVTSKPCKYCRIESSLKEVTGSGSEYIYNGIDRVDNTKGYITGNVVPCCKTCNRAKDTMTLEEFYAWVERVHANMKG